jgi:predicted secreted hydrolase
VRLIKYTTVAIVALVGLSLLLVPDDSEQVRASVQLAEAMGGDTTGFERATVVRDLKFPDDYGSHPSFKTEWWYYTGNLESEEGQRFGYELTIFRSALTPMDEHRDDDRSRWTSNQLFMAHFSFVDVEGEAFHAFERFSRGAAGLAGAQSSPYRIWLEDWSITGGDEGLFPKRLRAAAGDISIDLSLAQGKPVVLQGDRGLDRKGPGPGDASYYYSFTRIPTTGEVSVDGQMYTVTGSSWKDHEWSTSALSEDQVGWDWFALQLSTGLDIMFYQLRRRDGRASPFTNGIVVSADGSTEPLSLEDVEIDVLDTWTSPHSGGVYPSGWRFRIPRKDLDLRVTPVLPDQELNVSVRYWEGAVDLKGNAGGLPVTGWGYVELTGYHEPTDVSDRYRPSRSIE